MLGRVLRLDAINESLMLSTPLLVTLATFTTYLVSGRELTLPQVFTTIALFTVLRIPMMRLPYLIRTLINFNTGFNRLCEFLNSPEQHRDLTDPSLPVGGLRLDNVTALHQQKPVLEGSVCTSSRGTGGDHRCHRCGQELPAAPHRRFRQRLRGQHPSPLGSPIWATSPG